MENIKEIISFDETGCISKMTPSISIFQEYEQERISTNFSLFLKIYGIEFANNYFDYEKSVVEAIFEDSELLSQIQQSKNIITDLQDNGKTVCIKDFNICPKYNKINCYKVYDWLTSGLIKNSVGYQQSTMIFYASLKRAFILALQYMTDKKAYTFIINHVVFLKQQNTPCLNHVVSLLLDDINKYFKIYDITNKNWTIEERIAFAKEKQHNDKL